MNKLTRQAPSFVLVDDDEDDRFFMREAIRRTGSAYTIEEFDRGDAFFDYLKRELDEKGGAKVLWLVILSLKDQHLDTRTVLTRMRAHRIWKDIPVIVLTSEQLVDEERQMREAGATDYIQKSAGVDELTRHIKTTFAPWIANPRVLDTPDQPA